MKLDGIFTCMKCAKATDGRLHFDQDERLVELDGGAIVDGHFHCERCYTHYAMDQMGRPNGAD